MAEERRPRTFAVTRLRLAYFFSAMRHFRDELSNKDREVPYHELTTRKSDDRGSTLGEVLCNDVGKHRPERLVVVEPGDYRVQQQLQDAADTLTVELEMRSDRHFYSSKENFSEHTAGRDSLLLEYFYREMRRRHGVLLDDNAIHSEI